MKSTRVSSLFISLCLLISITIASAELLKTVCNQSKNPAECERAFSQDPRSKIVTKPRALAEICLDLAMANATKCLDSVKHLQTLTTTPPAWKPALDTCVQQFNLSAMEFRMARIELKKDPLSGSYDAMVAMDGVQICDDAMKKDNVNLPQVNGYGEDIRFWGLIANAIASLIKT